MSVYALLKTRTSKPMNTQLPYEHNQGSSRGCVAPSGAVPSGRYQRVFTSVPLLNHEDSVPANWDTCRLFREKWRDSGLRQCGIRERITNWIRTTAIARTADDQHDLSRTRQVEVSGEVLTSFPQLSMRLFRSSYGEGASLEVRRGTTVVKVELGRMSKKELPNVLLILDQIAQKAKEN